MRLIFFPSSPVLYLLCFTSLHHPQLPFVCACISRLHWCRHILYLWQPGSVIDLHNQFPSQNDNPWWGMCGEEELFTGPTSWKPCYIPVTLEMWPHHWCLACPYAFDWPTQAASFRASSCGSVSCYSKAAEALVARPSRSLLSPSALSDPDHGVGVVNGQYELDQMVGCSNCFHSSVHQGTVYLGKAFLKNFTVAITWKSHPWNGRHAAASLLQEWMCLHMLAKGCKVLVWACSDEHVMLGRSWSLPSPWIMTGMGEYWI